MFKSPFSYILSFLMLFCNLAISQNQISFNQVWEDQLFPNNPYNIVFDENNRPYFYVSNDNAGLKVYRDQGQDSFSNITTISNDNWDGLKVMHIEQEGNFLYLGVGSFFDNMQTSFGIVSVDISDPENPKYLDKWIGANTTSGTSSLQTDGDLAVLCAMNKGAYLFDISDPSNLEMQSHILADPDFPNPNPNSVMEPNARGVAIKDDYLFLCNDAGGLRVIDISDITKPIEVHKYINQDLLGTTQQAYNNIILSGDLAIIATDFCGLEFLDISDPLDVKQRAIWNPWDCGGAENIWINSPGHTNQMKFLPNSNDHILLVNASDTELQALDISDLNDIKEIGSIGGILDDKRTWGLGLNDQYVALAYFASLFPHFANEAKVKIYTWDYLSSILEFKNAELSIYPNPNNGQFSIQLDSEVSDLKIELYNILGSKISIDVMDKHSTTVEIQVKQKCAPGLYFLELSSNSFYASQKLYLK